MNLNFSIAYMFLSSFLINYYVMSPIMTNSPQNITFSMGKIYASFIMAFIMSILEVLMFDLENVSVTHNYYFILFIGLAISIWLYRKQVGINDIQYLTEMIEHHDMALFTSKNILEKPNISYRVREIAKRIQDTQEREITEMKEIIKQENS